jgi:hypothetical protein
MNCQELFNTGRMSQYATDCVRLGAIVREVQSVVNRAPESNPDLNALYDLTVEIDEISDRTAAPFDFDTQRVIIRAMSDANDILDEYNFFTAYQALEQPTLSVEPGEVW